MKRGILSIVVTLALCLGLLPVSVWAVEADPDPQELELDVGELPAGTQMIYIYNNTVSLLDAGDSMTNIDGTAITNPATEGTAFSYLTLTGRAQGIGIVVNADSADTVVELGFRNLDITSPADNVSIKPLKVMDGTVEIAVVGNVSLSAPQMAISVGGGRTTPTVSLAGSGSLTVRQTQGSVDCGMIEHNSTSPLAISILGDVRMEAPNGYLFDNKSGSGIYPISIDAGNITLSDNTGSTGFDGVTLVSSGTLSINGQTPAAQMEEGGVTTYLFAGDLDAALAYSSGNDGAVFTLLNDVTRTETLMIYISCTLNLNGHTIRNTNYHCISIGGTADVTIRGKGEVISEGGHALEAGVKTTLEGGTFTSRDAGSSGVCVNNREGTLIVRGDVVVRNTAGNHGLEVIRAKSVQLSGGTYSGGEAAIWIGSDSDLTLASLLESGYAYHSDDTPIPLPEGKVLTGDVTVGLCHHNGGAATFAPIEEEENQHSISCSACGTTNGTGNCILQNPVPDGETNHKGVCRCGREMTEAHRIVDGVYGSGYSEGLAAYKSVTFCRMCWDCDYVVPGSEEGPYTITPDFSVTAGQTKGRTLAVTCDPEEALEATKFLWGDGRTESPEFALPEDLAAGTYNYLVTVRRGEVYENLYVAVTVTRPSGGGGGGGGGGYVPPTPPVSTGTTTEGGTPAAETTAAPSASVSGGTATATVDTSMGSEIVKQAVANDSETVVIAPKITGDVSRAEVSIPASTVGQIGSQTGASLTVSTPVADVTIPNGALSSLAGAGGSVTVAAEVKGNTVDLSVTAGGEAVRDIPGGVTLTVPAESTTPGTVAVLVHADGTREVVRKSVAGDGSVTIPLDGSVKLEIVDNSKSFDDVPEDSWAADAVAFASAHELFNGTGAGQFSPEAPMTRGMLATVLHNLESNPAQALTGAFADVDNSQWYAEGVAWAAANGIISGYGSGIFGPDDNITREQLAVMLWRHAGSPAAIEKELHFTDADKASDWAQEALRWAVENGVMGGKGDGILDPRGSATRAEVAAMLMRFLGK